MLRTVKGIAASDGIGIAKAYTLIEPDLSFEKKTIDDPAAEYERVEKAFSASIAAVTNAVVLMLVSLSPAVAVGAVGLPLSAGLASGAMPFAERKFVG